MAFRKGKGNPYAKLQAELTALKAELAYERTTKPMLRIFADKLGEAMLVKLAHQPYAEWPQFAKDTFAYVSTLMPTAAYLYKDNLPKE